MNYEKAAAALKVISHPQRMKIIEILRNQELSVSEIQKKIKGKQSITSQHLNNMKNKDILKAQRKANLVYYSITNKEILKIIDCINRCAY